MTDPQLTALVEHSRENNASRGISGLLLHSGGNFMQVLEGEEMVITTLYAKISRDPRHTGLRTLHHKAAETRLFPDWGMQLANTKHLQTIDQAGIDKTLLRLRLSREKDAALETQALSLLEEFRRQLMNQAA